MIVEAYDVGGTWIRGAIIQEGTIKVLKKERTEKDFISQIKKISSLLKDYASEKMVILVPGPVEKGILLKAPPLSLVESLDIVFALQDLNKEIIVENDLNAALLGEYYYGEGKYHKNFYLLALSTGIGAGILLDGNILHGSVGEFGHCVLERREEYSFLCGCGNRGCWASLASGKGIEQFAKNIFGKELPAEEVFTLAQSSSPHQSQAKKILSMVRDYNAQGIGTMINAFGVEKIIIMGSVGIAQFESIIPSKEEISKYTVNTIPELVKTSLGDSLGLLGAYCLVQKR